MIGFALFELEVSWMYGIHLRRYIALVFEFRRYKYLGVNKNHYSVPRTMITMQLWLKHLATNPSNVKDTILLNLSMLNRFKDYTSYIHIVNHIIYLAWSK